MKSNLTREEKELIKAKRRQIKSNILQLQKANEDIFKLWAYQKSFDETFLRNQARFNLSELEKLEKEYERLGAIK